MTAAGGGSASGQGPEVWQARRMFAALTEEWDTELRSGDPLEFPGYADQLAGLDHESVRTGTVGEGPDRYVLVEGDFDVIGGSMGLVHGEKVVRAFDRATAARLPVVVVTRSGGARMQEGMVSLIQMARTAAAADRHAAAGLLSIAVHRSPTTGGVFASYGSLTDLRVAEAGATIGFAGPRVVEQTTGEAIDGRSHSAESALAAGLVDAVVPPDGLIAWVEAALGHREAPLRAPRPPAPARPTLDPRPALDQRPAFDAIPAPDPRPVMDPIPPLDRGPAGPPEGIDPAWAAVLAARLVGRPSGIHVAAAAASSWIELGAGTDPALRTALTTLDGRRVVVVACDRYAGGGRPGPAGYRVVQRGIALAGRLGLPVVTLVDTPGAEPVPDAENDAIAAEIARTFAAMARVPVPTISVCVGEGGSGGALALAGTDRFLVQEHAVFSVIGPEGAAAILERDADRAPEVAARLKLTSGDLLELGIVDAVVPDDLGATVDALGRALTAARDDAANSAAGAGGGRGRRTRFDAATAAWLFGDRPDPPS